MVGAKFSERQRRRLNVEVDAIEQRPADAGAVTLDLRGRAAALVLRVAEVAAREGIRLLGNSRYPLWP